MQYTMNGYIKQEPENRTVSELCELGMKYASQHRFQASERMFIKAEAKANGKRQKSLVMGLYGEARAFVHPNLSENRLP